MPFPPLPALPRSATPLDRAALDAQFPYVSQRDRLRRCTRCVLPETMPFIDFDAHGVCGYCRSRGPLSVLGDAALEALVAPHRRSDGRPDCIVGVSGGRDSIFGLHYLKQVLEKEGIEVETFALEPHRPNIVARLKGNGKKRPLLIMAHTDTVNVDPKKWTFPPFSATRDSGYVYGRGTVDDKDNVVAALMILLELKRKNVPLDRDVIFLAEAGEEGSTRVGIQFMVNQQQSNILRQQAMSEKIANRRRVFDNYLYERAMTPTVVHEPGRFVVRTEAGDATLDYHLDGDVLDIEHTWTPPALRGRNLAAALTEAAFAHAQAHGLRVRPTCSYTRRYLVRHPELRALAAGGG